MSYAKASQKYTEAAVLSASPAQLVVMLYDGAIRFMQQGAVALGQDQLSVAREKLFKAEAILNELNQALNMDSGDGELARNLRSLYLYCKQQLLTALLERDASMIEPIIGLMRELRGSWAQIASQQVPAAAAG